MESCLGDSSVSDSSDKKLCFCKTVILDNVSKAIKKTSNEDGITFKNILGSIRSFFPIFKTKRQAEQEVKKVLRYGLKNGSFIEVDGKFINGHTYRMTREKKGVCQMCGKEMKRSTLIQLKQQKQKKRTCCRRRPKELITEEEKEKQKERYRRGWIKETFPKESKKSKNRKINKKKRVTRNRVTWKRHDPSKWSDVETPSTNEYFTALTDDILSKHDIKVPADDGKCSEVEKTPLLGQKQTGTSFVIPAKKVSRKRKNCETKLTHDKTTSTESLNLRAMESNNIENKKKKKPNPRKKMGDLDADRKLENDLDLEIFKSD